MKVSDFYTVDGRMPRRTYLIAYSIAAFALLAFAGCETPRCGVDDDFLKQNEETPISAGRFSELFRAAKQRDKDALVAFVKLGENSPSSARELGYYEQLLQLARIWGDRAFADAISVLPEETRVSIGGSLISQAQSEIIAKYPQTLSSYHLSQTTSSVPRRPPRR